MCACKTTKSFYNSIMNNKPLIIAGPTASGKSDFAHKLAKRVNGAIINCDSVQIYRGIENISASPFAEQNDGVFDCIDGIPYKLFSILPLSEHISVADYVNLAKRAYDETLAMGKTPIFVGGSGYYINVLLNGISAIPEISDEVRNRARKFVEDNIDDAIKLLPDDFKYNDPQRVARALEVFLQTGTHLTQWQKMPRSGAFVPDAVRVLISPEREILLKRIASRIPEMIRGGALRESQYIIDNKLNETRAIGSEQICKMLRGELSEQSAIENWIVKTNQYAKRQRTWFRTQYNPDVVIPHVPNDEDLENLIKKLS